ncbi:MAG: VCBS repeat-containing protein [Saonia sp.]
MSRNPALFILMASFFFGCKTPKEDAPPLFEYVDASRSKITFSNTITESDSINVIDFQYCYNGGGTGIGDFNNDGLPDIVFTGNQVSSSIYLNKGGLRFMDISSIAGFSTSSWITGVAIVDINADGWDDIYLNVGGANCNADCNNLLYINKGPNEEGIPIFMEQARAYGLDDGCYAQQSVFFDYDGDGDLDIYIVHNGNSKFDKNSPVPKQYMPPRLKDYLLRNEWNEQLKHPVFTNVSVEMGIDHAGFGLGIALNDLNNDQLPDIYVSNDFITDDLLYINRGIDAETGNHLGFSEMSEELLSHETYNAMGVDITDVNNDAQPDILVLDMLPQDYKRQKKMLGSMNYDKYMLGQRNQYASQYMHNTLQLGNGFIDSIPLKNSEVGFMSGISSTDWSWAPIMMDFDNDGDKDIYITNGYVKDITDLDFINFSSQNNIFGTPEAKNNKLKKMVDGLPGIHLPNFFYENTAGSQFNDVSNIWVQEQASFSNGAAYADFDLDGDIDLAVNNINAEAFLLENKASLDTTKHYIRLRLKGTQQNAHAIGAKAIVWSGGGRQSQFQSVIRGYLSSMEPVLHFGVKSSKIDSVKVIWPNGKISILKEVTTDQLLTIDEKDSTSNFPEPHRKQYLFNTTDEVLNFEHQENISNDYVYQHLLMRQYSQLGPCIAAANIDGISGDEIFIGGSKGEPGQLWFQDSTGLYRPVQPLDTIYEDTNAVFVDIDNDGDLDLYVTSGGNEFKKESDTYQDRLYLNDGKGVFNRDENAIPRSFQSNSCVRPSDIDNDGDIDFFIGGRMVPQSYPNIPESKILINNEGRFTEQKSPELTQMGMVTDAVWQDLDGDGWQDLIVVGEWMAISIYKNDKGQFYPMSSTWIDKNNREISTRGWWNCIKAADFDDDGDIDFLVGNQGLNGFVRPKLDSPVFVYTGDFDKNGSPDPVLAQYFETEQGKKLLPVHTRDDIMKQLVTLKDKYLTYDQFSQIDFMELLNIKDLDAETLVAAVFETSYVENLGQGKFRLLPLPSACQVAPVNNILVKDFTHDGRLDALLVGNDFTAETHYGRFDALTGIFMKGSTNGFTIVPSKDSGFYVPRQSHHITSFMDKEGKKYIIATQNKGKTNVFSTNKTIKKE